jgi:hypothetical protein
MLAFEPSYLFNTFLSLLAGYAITDILVLSSLFDSEVLLDVTTLTDKLTRAKTHLSGTTFWTLRAASRLTIIVVLMESGWR